jgi:hypothetical protein
MANSLLKDVFAPAGMVEPPRKTAAVGMPAPKVEKAAGINMAVPDVDPKVREKQVRDLSK